MKTAAALALFLLTAIPLLGQESRIAPGPDGSDVSLKLEIERAVANGIAYLKSQQDDETGAWSDPVHPAFTALAVSAILGDPTLDREGELPAAVDKGLAFLLSQVQPDGGIYGKGLATYNTSLSMMALMQAGRGDLLPTVAKARRFLIGQQQDYGKPGEVDELFDGGIGYGGSYTHSDLSNTHLALEALYYSQKVLADTGFDEAAEVDLDWNAAIEFVSATQNTEATMKRLGDWAALREEDRGGFVYFPGNTKSEEIEVDADGSRRTALRSYGSMTYAGLLSFIYAEMDRDDPRILAAMEWLQRNFTLDENPGMDAQGLFYYYHTMAKALAITGNRELVDPQGRRIDWRKELALKLMSEQRRDGSWINEGSNRWMENNEILVTAYALLALQHAHRHL